MRLRLLPIAVGAAVPMLGAPALAHHGTSITYFVDKTITLNGRITEFVFGYPHPQIYFDVTDEKGTVQHWGVELGPTPRMMRNRVADIYTWSRTSMVPDDEITITCNPHKKVGATVCLAKEIIINGQLLPLSSEHVEQLKQAQ